MEKLARNVAVTTGIIELLDPKKGRALSENAKSVIHVFYHDDAFSRQMPGTKDYW